MSRAARAFTDPYSNIVVLPGIDIREHFAALAGKRPLPPRLLPTLLHELVHHWCFDSPVGLALMLQSMLARRYAIQVNLGENVDNIEFIDGFTRHHYLASVLKTLSEGLALFAEHDLVIGASSIVSPPVVLASLMVTPRDAGQQRFELMNALLSVIRLSRDHVRSKANLLVQSLTPADGAYLASYLSIKDIWLTTASRVPKLQDADLFIHFFRCFIFCDWELVAVLLDPGTSDVGTFEPIGTHVSKRIHKFVDMPSDELTRLVDEFEDRGLRGVADYFEHKTDRVDCQLNCHPTERSGAEQQVGKERLGKLFDSVFARDPSGNEAMEGFARMNASMLTFRTFITLAHGEFDATVAPGGSHVVLTEGGAHVATLPSPGASPGWRGRGELELAWSTTLPLGMYAFLRLEKKMHAFRLHGDVEAHEALHDPAGSRTVRLEFGEETGTWLRDAVLGDEVGAYVLNLAEEHADDLVEQLFCKPFRLPMSQEDGLLEALGGTTADVQRAAMLSLCFPCRRPLSKLDWPQGVSADDYIAKVCAVFAKHWPSFTPLEVTDDLVFSRI